MFLRPFNRWCMPVLGMLACFAISTVVWADERTEKYVEVIQEKGAAVREAEEQFKADPQLLEIDSEMNRYLGDSLWVVYVGLNYYMYENGELPGDPSSLAGSKYIPVWPNNPFADWTPMKVQDVSAAFTAGAFTYQLCPPEFYSRFTNPRAMSFEISVFGPSADYGRLGDAHPSRKNTWAQVPEGALYMLGSVTQSAASLQKKLDEAQKNAPQQGSEGKGGENK